MKQQSLEIVGPNDTKDIDKDKDNEIPYKENSLNTSLLDISQTETTIGELASLDISRRNILEKVTATIGLLGISVGATKSIFVQDDSVAAFEISDFTLADGSTSEPSSGIIPDRLREHRVKGRLFHLYEGQSIGLGWKIDRITYAYFEEVVDTFATIETSVKGHLVIDLLQHGILGKQSCQVHVCSHRGSPKGIAHSKYLDFFLMDSSGRTNEYVGRTLLSLSHKIALMEQKDNRKAGTAASYLQTYEERLIALNHRVVTSNI